LAELAAGESFADVRRRLYEALLPQASLPEDALVSLVGSEKDLAARVAGLNAVGHAVRLNPGSAAARVFDEQFVPELARIATSPNNLNLQMRAVFALRRAGTPAAQAALESIADTASIQVARAARNGLPSRDI
jgi:hypothetical protein